jgi:glutathione synthase
MSHRFAFIIDPIEDIDITGDSSFALMLEAQSRSCTIYYAQMGDLELLGDDPWAMLTEIEVQAVPGAHFKALSKKRYRLNELDAIFMRKDPPIETEYFASTHILDFVDRDRVIMVNAPQALRDCNEKIFAMRWPELMPPTFVARSIDRIKDFIREHKDVVVKPINTSGGAGVIRIIHKDKNTSSILEMMTDHGRVAIVAQAYLENVTKGDRRIILVAGQPIGVINRRPSEEDLRSNMHVGGTAEVATLNDRDREICAALREGLLHHNLLFVGIDVIDGLLTEINVTSPTGFQELKSLSGIDGAAILIDWIQSQIRSTTSES